MIGVDEDGLWTTLNEVSPCFEAVYDCKHLFIVHVIILFSCSELAGVKGNGSQDLVVVVLGEYPGESPVRGIGLQNVLFAGVGVMKEGRRREDVFYGLECQGSLFVPRKIRTFSEQRS